MASPFFACQIQSILNSFTQDTSIFYDYSSNFIQLLAANSNSEQVSLAAGLFLCKAIGTPDLCTLYARLAQVVTKHLEPPQLATSFCHELLSHYEQIFKQLVSPQKCEAGEEVKHLPACRTRRNFTVARFLGELYKVGVVTQEKLQEYILRSLDSRNEEAYEYICVLLTTCGQQLERSSIDLSSSATCGRSEDIQNGGEDGLHEGFSISALFAKLTELSKETGKLSLRLRIALSDLLEIRQNVWLPQKAGTHFPTANRAEDGGIKQEDFIGELIEKYSVALKPEDSVACEGIKMALSEALNSASTCSENQTFFSRVCAHSKESVDRLRKEILLFHSQIKYQRGCTGKEDQGSIINGSDSLEALVPHMWNDFLANVPAFGALFKSGFLSAEVMVDCIELLLSKEVGCVSEGYYAHLVSLVEAVGPELGKLENLARESKVGDLPKLQYTPAEGWLGSVYDRVDKMSSDTTLSLKTRLALRGLARKRKRCKAEQPSMKSYTTSSDTAPIPSIAPNSSLTPTTVLKGNLGTGSNIAALNNTSSIEQTASLVSTISDERLGLNHATGNKAANADDVQASQSETSKPPLAPTPNMQSRPMPAKPVITGDTFAFSMETGELHSLKCPLNLELPVLSSPIKAHSSSKKCVTSEHLNQMPGANDDGKCKREAASSAAAPSGFEELPIRCKPTKDPNVWRPNLRRWTRLEDTEFTPDEKQTEAIVKQTRGILNKLTPENFDKLCEKFLKLDLNERQDRISAVTKVVFEKAIIDEPSFSAAYAQMVHHVCQHSRETAKFRKKILDQCQKEFRKTNRNEDEIAKKKREIVEAPADKKEALKADLEEFRTRMRRRSLGNVRFIGELFNLQMLTAKIMVDCVQMLLGNQDEESYECLCTLLTIVGQKLENSLKDVENRAREARARGGPMPKFIPEDNYMDKTFKRLKTLSGHQKLSFRIRFVLLDLVELRDMKWIPRRPSSAPKKINEIGRNAIREEQEQMRLVEAWLETSPTHLGGQHWCDSVNLDESTQMKEGYWSSVPSAETIPFSKVKKPRHLKPRWRNQLLPTPAALRLSPADVQYIVKNIFEEYLSDPNSKDTLFWIKTRFPGSHILVFIDALARVVAEMFKEHQHVGAGKLVRMLISHKCVQRDQVLDTIVKGVIPDIPDIQIDFPKAMMHVAKFVLELFADETSFDWLTEVSQRVEGVWGNSYVEFISTIQDLFELKRNELVVKSLDGVRSK